jgi:hypothetical protein
MLYNQTKPFILNFATKREFSQSSEIGGFYSEQNDMWFDTQSMMPAIDSLAFNSAELNTKTNVDVESDDESSYALELMTKTKVHEESDDSDFRSCILNGLLTKTDVAQEKDDNSMSPYDL